MREAWGDRSSNFRSQSNPPICDWSVRGFVFPRINENKRFQTFIRGNSMISREHESIGNGEWIAQC